METTPAAVADLIIAGAKAVGAKVNYTNAGSNGRFGIVVIEMPDGVGVTLKIEIE